MHFLMVPVKYFNDECLFNPVLKLNTTIEERLLVYREGARPNSAHSHYVDSHHNMH